MEYLATIQKLTENRKVGRARFTQPTKKSECTLVAIDFLFFRVTSQNLQCVFDASCNVHF